MAKKLEDIKDRRVLANLRSSGSSEHIKEWMAVSAATGEIAIELNGESGHTALWTLAKDGNVVSFPSKETVAEMISTGAVAEVDTIEASVGLNEDGSIVSGDTSVWKNTHYINTAATIVSAVTRLDQAVHQNSQYIAESDYELSKDDNKVVVSLAQVDARISGTAENLVDIKLGTYVKDTTKTGAIAYTDTLEDALSKLENTIGANAISNADGSINVTTASTGTDINVNIKSGEHVLAKDGSNGIYTNLQLSGVTPEDTNVKEEYVLKATDGTILGSHIKIYKDSAYKEIYLGTSADTINTTTGEITKQDGDKQSLNYAYMKADGTYDLVKVDVSTFLVESEFASGVTSTDHIVHGVVDTASEKDESEVDFLTVGGGGFKVSGIKDAIDTKINKLDADVSGKSADEHVSVEVVEADGKVTAVIVTTNNIASAQALSDEIAARKAVDGQNGSTYAANTNAHYISAATSLNDADVKIDAIIGEESDTVFSSESTVAKNISDIKADIQAFKNKLTLSGKENAYAKVTVVSAATGTSIEVSAVTKTVSAATALEQGLADAYDVRTFAVSNVSGGTSNVEGVQVKDENGNKVLDFSTFKLDCGEF